MMRFIPSAAGALFLCSSSVSVPAQNHPEVLWSFPTVGTISTVTPAIGDDGRIYVGTRDFFGGANHHVFYALNPDGMLAWKRQASRPFTGSPVIDANGIIYVGSYDFNLYAYDQDGSVIWKFPTESALTVSPAIATDGTIYFCTSGRSLYALRPDGLEKWRFDTSVSLSGSPVIGADGTIYFGTIELFSGNNKLFAINPDGTLKWLRSIGSINSSPSIGSDGTVYAADYDGKLHAFRNDGVKLWEHSVDSRFFGTPAIGPDKTLYLGGFDGKVYAIQPDGTRKWEFESTGIFRGSAIVDADGVIYIASQQGRFFAINPDGTSKWEFNSGGDIVTSSTIRADGTILLGVGLLANRLYAIRGGSGLASGSWPVAGHDTKNTGNVAGPGDPREVKPLPPLITVHPINRSAVPGTDVIFEVYAFGTSPLTYQWQFNGTDLPGEHGPSLALKEIQIEHAGEYTVFISNPAGSVISRGAFLKALTNAPIISTVTDQVLIEKEIRTVTFTVSDVETPPGSIQVQVRSSNQELIPDSNISTGGVNNSRASKFMPLSGKTGVAVLTIQAVDGDGLISESSFQVTVNGVLKFLPDSVAGDSEVEVVLPIRVRSFTDIVSFQFTMHWNPTVIRFIGVEQFGVPGMTEERFGTTQTAEGLLRVSWDESGGSGVTLENDSTVFGVRFKLIGDSGSISDVGLTSIPLPIEASQLVYGTKLAPVAVLHEHGSIRVFQDRIRVSGRIRYYQGNWGIPEVDLSVSQEETEFVTSNIDGTFNYFLDRGDSYTLIPVKSSEDIPNRGVSTLDIALIRRHILGLQTLDSPYKLLAADVNNSSSITALDLAYIRRVILGIDKTFPGGLWRFVRSEFNFSDPLDPWENDRTRQYEALFEDIAEQDFIGIKRGDVNGSWTPPLPHGKKTPKGSE